MIEKIMEEIWLGLLFIVIWFAHWQIVGVSIPGSFFAGFFGVSGMILTISGLHTIFTSERRTHE